MGRSHLRLIGPRRMPCDARGDVKETSCVGGRHNMPQHHASWPLTFDLESDVPVACDLGYLCANFSLPRPLCSRLRLDVRDRQTDIRQTSDAHHRLIPPTLEAVA